VALEAKLIGKTHVAASTKEENYKRIPNLDEIKFSENPAYVHITSNNTIFGTEWTVFPETGAIPLIADMSSDILSQPFDATKFALIYAGAQKNIGPGGVVVVIARKSYLAGRDAALPTMLNYEVHMENNSLYNTPPVFGVYIVGKVAKWLKAQGGLAVMAKRNEEKAKPNLRLKQKQLGLMDLRAIVVLAACVLLFIMPCLRLAASNLLNLWKNSIKTTNNL
jgi:phosphoserine aminotransferase